MVDTLRLFTHEYSLSEQNEFTRLLTEKNGEIVSEKCICNLPRFNAEILPEKQLLTFHTSLPKLLYGTSLKEIGEGDLRLAKEKISDRLKVAGVKANLEDFKVSQVDFCANLQTAHKPFSYISVLSRFAMSRRQKQIFAGESVSWRNSRGVFRAYDKVQEIVDGEGEDKAREYLSRVGSGSNVLRLESSLRKTLTVEKCFKVGEVHLENVFDFARSRAVLLSDLEKLTAIEQMELNLEDIESMWEQNQKLYKRGTLLHTLSDFGIPQWIEKFNGDYRAMQTFFESRGMSRRSIFRALREIRQKHRRFAKLEAKDLIAEIRDKLRNVA
jgi:hypothetical protein